MIRISCLILLLCGFFPFIEGVRPKKTLEWWQSAVIYQIYPRSFKDSDGDGIGDLKGIYQKLDYIKEIGAEAIWISPIFSSPMVDFGYDISNYREIDPIFGTMRDFEKLLRRAHRKGMFIQFLFV